MAFESGVVLEDKRSAVIASMYKGKGERNECKNYIGIHFLSVVGKIYAGFLVDRVRRVTGGLINDEQGVFREGRGCEKAQEKKTQSVCGFYRSGEGVR